MSAETPLLPARMLNEYTYCRRLFALEWLHGEWADNRDTVDGKRVHRRVDVESKADVDEPGPTRQLWLSDDELRLTAKLDLVESADGEAIPVDYKRGKPREDGQAWMPERVQVCAQGLLLRAHGYRCERGYLWFAEARRRVEVVLDDELVEQTLAYRDAALDLAETGALPPPLLDSPRCPRCSLVGICLPDETNLLRRRSAQVRPIAPARQRGGAVHVQFPGGSVGKRGAELSIRDRGKEVGRVRIQDTTTLAVYGNVSVSAQALSALAERGVPVGYHSYGGWFQGLFTPPGGHGVPARVEQHRAASDEERKRSLAAGFVRGKIRNCRVLLRRNGEGVDAATLKELKRLADKAPAAPNVESLRGVEGAAARLYFAHFDSMLHTDEVAFAFDGRNRRPPRDPVNAVLSLGYSMLARECTAALWRVGLDPYVGFLHELRPGRPALALDLMEEFRPVVADSVAIRAFNTGELDPDDFVIRSAGVNLSTPGRKRFLGAFERRLEQELSHPEFGIRMSYRRIIEVQARLLARTLLGELDTYPALSVR